MKTLKTLLEFLAESDRLPDYKLDPPEDYYKYSGDYQDDFLQSIKDPEIAEDYYRSFENLIDCLGLDTEDFELSIEDSWSAKSWPVYTLRFENGENVLNVNVRFVQDDDFKADLYLYLYDPERDEDEVEIEKKDLYLCSPEMIRVFKELYHKFKTF